MCGQLHIAHGPQTLMFLLETSYFYNLCKLATLIINICVGAPGRYGLENIKQTFLSYFVFAREKNIEMS